MINKFRILRICKKYNIRNYIINKNNTIDVNGDVSLIGFRLSKLPLKFNNIYGSFDCSYNYLTSLKGCPKYVKGSFYCHNNYIYTLHYIPEKIDGDLSCTNNRLTKIEYSSNINGNIYAYNNKLESIENYKNIIEKIHCTNKKELLRKLKLKDII